MNPPHDPASESPHDVTWDEVEAELSRPITTDPDGNSVTSTSPDRPPRRSDPSGALVMVETAFLASAASLIWLINFYFPIGPVLQVFFPVPIALIYLRWNARAAWMGLLVSGLLLSVLMGPVRSVLFIMPYGLLGVLLGVLWRRQASWFVSIAISTLLAVFGFFFRIWLTSLMLGEDLWTYGMAQVTDFLEWVWVNLGWLTPPSFGWIQAATIVMITGSRIVYLLGVHLVAWLLLDRLSTPIPRPPKWIQVLMDYE